MSIIASSASGLSPLTRGTPASGVKSHRRCRFIPAGAGNSRFRRCKPGYRAVYPRWRGELAVHHSTNVLNSRFIPAGAGNSRCCVYRTCAPGLSPLARGTHRRHHPVVPVQRFIPAGAGNSLWPAKNSLVGGLSPLARGTLRRLAVQPAPTAVYPRWRGELKLAGNLFRGESGLSPLARGTL